MENLLPALLTGKCCNLAIMGRNLSCSDIIITQRVKENKPLTENK